jgi:hypothetical protein
MIERNDTVDCLACPDRTTFKEIVFHPRTLEHVAHSNTFQEARDGECNMIVTYEDEQGKIHQAEVDDILVPYYFGLYLEHITGSY